MSKQKGVSKSIWFPLDSLDDLAEVRDFLERSIGKCSNAYAVHFALREFAKAIPEDDPRIIDKPDTKMEGK